MILDAKRISAAVAELRDRVGPNGHLGGPVPLVEYFSETGLDHVELPVLTFASVVQYLRQEGVHVDDVSQGDDALAGFIVAAGKAGWAFVSSADPVPRRRFTAAHELGHFILHRATMGQFRADTDSTLCEGDDKVADLIEREANRFASELLMPAESCRARALELREKYRCCPRGVLVYRLAGELLVSREAMRYRLQSLEVGDG